MIETDVPSVTIDPTQVTQALAELIANAIQATEAVPDRGGNGTGDRPIDGRSIGHVTVRVGHDSFSRRVVIDVTDDGRGMASTTLQRAFDPFFSALPAGRRRGMGLPKALRWVEGSGGSIRLESEPKRGTRAIVLLPAAARESGEISAEQSPQEFIEPLSRPA